jgi:hypothetical protein
MLRWRKESASPVGAGPDLQRLSAANDHFPEAHRAGDCSYSRRVRLSKQGGVMIPDYIDPEAWAGFVEMRQAMRKVPFTARAQQMILRDLAEIRAKGHCPNAALDQSVVMGWRGVWPAKDRVIERAPQSAAETTRKQAESWRLTEAERVASEEARKAVMSRIRRVA